MRSYECLYIVHPGADSSELERSAEKYTGLITEQGGTISKIEQWGKRKLAYEINKVGDGNFVLLRFAAEPMTIADLEFKMRVDDRIFRYMTSYEIPEGAGRSDELMALTERKERERRGGGGGSRGRGRPGGPGGSGGPGGGGGRGGGGFRDRGPRNDGDEVRRPPADSKSAGDNGGATSTQPAPSRTSGEKSEGGSE